MGLKKKLCKYHMKVRNCGLEAEDLNSVSGAAF